MKALTETLEMIYGAIRHPSPGMCFVHGFLVAGLLVMVLT